MLKFLPTFNDFYKKYFESNNSIWIFSLEGLWCYQVVWSPLPCHMEGKHEPNICKRWKPAGTLRNRRNSLLKSRKTFAFVLFLPLPLKGLLSLISQTGFYSSFPFFFPAVFFSDILSQHECSCPSSSSSCSSLDLLSGLFAVTVVFLFPCCPSSHPLPRAEAPSRGCGEVALQENLRRVLYLPPAFTLEARCGLWTTKLLSPWILPPPGCLLWGLLEISSLELLLQHFCKGIPQSRQNLL